MGTKITVREIDYNGGWFPAPEYLYFGYDTNILQIASGDVTSEFTKGLKIKFINNGTVKYFYVVSSVYDVGLTSTLVTLSGEVDVALTTVSEVFISYADCPKGFKRGEDWYSFRAYLATQTTFANGATVIFNTEDYDIGGNYNNSTSVFTAPISGIYVFDVHAAVISPVDQQRHGLGYIVNSGATNVFAKIACSGVGAQYINGSFYVKLDKGDTIKIVTNSDATKDYAGEATTFSGNFVSLA